MSSTTPVTSERRFNWQLQKSNSPDPTYTDEVLTRVDYSDGSYKTLTYTDGLLTQVDYVQSGFQTIRKTLSYTDGVWAGTVETLI